MRKNQRKASPSDNKQQVKRQVDVSSAQQSLFQGSELLNSEGASGQLALLRQLHAPQRTQMVQRMAQRYGNRAVGRMLAPTPQTGFALGPIQTQQQQLANGEIKQTQRMAFTQTIARSSDSAENETDPQTESPISIAELAAPEEAEELDAIAATLAYATQVTHAGATPRGFGVTRSSASIRNLTVTPGAGTFTVAGEFFYDVQWQVRSPTGPGGEVDIASDTDPDINAANYQLVAKDLTPDMGDLNGRPPRDHYWAKDLTERHELFHANERSTFGQNGATAAQTWLNTQTANTAAEVQPLLQQSLTVALTEINRLMNTAPGKEERAYGDGAPLYKARADSIKAKGDAGDYGQINVNVTATNANGDWFSNDEVYVKLALGGKTHTTGQQSMGDGDTKTFTVAPNQLFTDTTNNGDTVSVEVRESDILIDDSLLSLNWTLPNDATESGSNYEAEAKLA